MKNSNNSIDSLISRILSEEIDSKSMKMADELEEDLKGKQSKIDVAAPKGKITAADFKKLRSQKKETKESEEIDEWFFYDSEDEDESTPGDYEGDEEAEDEAEELSAQEPTYVGRGLSDNKPGKIFGSFSDDHGWYNQDDEDFDGDFDFEYDEEEFDDQLRFLER